jgi:hypothetical protein
MELAPSAASALREIEYPPIRGVYLAYPNEALQVGVASLGVPSSLHYVDGHYAV